MRVIILIITFALMCSNCFAESINVKLGIADVFCEGVNSSPVASLSYEYNKKLNQFPEVGVELGIKGYSTKLHDTQIEHDWLLGKEMGILNTFAPFVTLKVYLPYNLYTGIGVTYLDNYFVEDSRIYPEGYIINADVDDEVGLHLTAGIKLIDDFFLEAEFLIADIDIESNVHPKGILEARSRFNNYTIMIVKKWKF